MDWINQDWEHEALKDDIYNGLQFLHSNDNIAEKLIDDKIRSHEIRVGLISGIIGALFTFGITHAVWLLKNQ